MAKPPRRRKRRRKRKPAEDDAPPPRTIPEAADKYEAYYRAQQIVAPSDWLRFISTMHRPLPTTFRLCAAAVHQQLVTECLESGESLLRGSGALPAARELRWCRGWQLDGVSKEELKSSREPSLAAMQSWLTHYGSLGVLTRQAIESMVPVALLQPRPSHAVLDMCASPGSKTTQALEAIWAEGEPDGGYVVANDFSAQRCAMLLRRCAAYGVMCSRLVISRHKAQQLPLPRPPESAAADGAARYPAGTFDRIICDVPCSGDGTTRKNPSVWHKWSAEFGCRLHPLQLQIAMRGAALLRVGG